jgi:hypothetical protein
MVKGGRTFVRRLIDSLSNVNNRNAKILLRCFLTGMARDKEHVLMTIPKNVKL